MAAFAIITRVALKPGAADAVAALFEATNPALVRDQPDWRGAEMYIDHEEASVTVIAHWRDPDSYAALAASQRFRDTMARFAPYFAGPPEIQVTARAVAMTPESVAGQAPPPADDGPAR